MANRYWVGGNANWDATAGTKWATTSGGAGGAAVPTAADDVYLDNGAGTGNVTIPTATTVVCRSLDCTNYANTLTFASATAAITIGDGTAGASNIALKFVAGMTVTLTGVGTINFVSTSATQQTVTTGGKTMPTLVFNGAGGSWQLQDNTSTSGSFTLSAGTLDTNNKTVTIAVSFGLSGSTARTLTLGSSAITLNRTTGSCMDATTSTNLTVTANTATVTQAGGSTSGLILGSVDYNGMSVAYTSGSQTTPGFTCSGATIKDFTWTGPASKTSTPVITGNLTCTGAFTWTGNSATNRSILAPSTTVFGTPITITATSASLTNVDIKDITWSVSGSFTVSSVGDCGGLSGITVTTPVTRYAVASGNVSSTSMWSSTSGGSGGSSVPLPQDTVYFDGSSAAGTYTNDMPRWGTDINFTNFTRTFSQSTNQETYGSLTLASGMTYSGSSGWQFAARSSKTITSAGQIIGTSGVVFQGPGGTWTLQDAFNTTGSTVHTDGTLNTNGFSYTTTTFTSSGTRTRVLTLGASTINLSSTAATTVWNITATGLTINSGTSNIVISTTSANTRTFVGATFNYYGFTYTVAGSTGQLNMTSGQYFDNFNFSDATNARTVTFTAGGIFASRNFNVFGTSGKLMTVKSLTGASVTYIELVGAVNTGMDYLSVQDVWGLIPGKFYAGANSTSVSGNTNINIAAAPTPGPYIDFIAFNSASGSTVTATFSAWHTVVSGRTLHAVYGASGSATTINTPTGWTSNVANGNQMKQFQKVSDGTETGITVTTAGAPAIATVIIAQLGGFTGTPTYDVSETNSSGAATSLNSTSGSGITNTGTPALALVSFQASGSMGNSVSATNSYEYSRESTSSHRVLAKTLTSLAATSTTYTWTTSRTPVSISVIYKDVAAAGSTVKQLSALGVG